MKKSLELPFYFIMYIWGGIVFFFTRKTPLKSFYALRYFYIRSNGRVNSFINKQLGLFYPKYKSIKAKGILGDLSNTEIKEIVDQINANGFYEIPQKLDHETIDKLVAFAKSTPTKYIDTTSDVPKYKKELVLVDENNIISPRYQFIVDSLIENEHMQQIIFDETFLAISNEFFKCKPVFNDIQMWWSFPFNGKGASAAAQMYHFDMDRVKFLKFFFYLTDVGPDNGPHCYVKKSNRIKPKELLFDGRKEDELIQKYYPAEDMLELKGKKGSMLIVDTSGWHKGKPLTKDKRLLLQIQYANSLFGAKYKEMNLPTTASEKYKDLSNTYSHTYNQVIKNRS